MFCLPGCERSSREGAAAVRTCVRGLGTVFTVSNELMKPVGLMEAVFGGVCHRQSVITGLL